MHIVILQISGTFPSCMIETLYPLHSNTPFSAPPAPGNHHSTLCFFDFDSVNLEIWVLFSLRTKDL